MNRPFLAERREQGSFFPWSSFLPGAKEPSPWDGRGQLWGSGRDAFRALLNLGRREKGWRRLWIPSYFCGNVVSSFLSCGLEIVLYPDGPQTRLADIPAQTFREGDVFLAVNFFGLRQPYSLREFVGEGVELIEDHTHDPWSAWAASSRADWCVASLRKTLPVPEGGVLWSPLGHTLPKAVRTTSAHRRISMEMLTAMILKSLYLEGHDIDKTLFRNLAVASEEAMASGRVSGAAEWTGGLLEILPALMWRDARKRNYGAFRDAFAGVPWATVLLPEDYVDCCPFAGILVFDSPARREAVRRGLIESRVYPAVLWPQDAPLIPGVPPEHFELGRKILAIHCDMRNDEKEMERASSLVKKYGEAVPACGTLLTA